MIFLGHNVDIRCLTLRIKTLLTQKLILMKKLLTLLTALLLVLFGYTQEHNDGENIHFKTKEAHHVARFTDISFHLRKPLEDKMEYIFWTIHKDRKRKFVLDFQYGLHTDKTADLGFGYDCAKRSDLWVVPKMSLLIGEYPGIAPGFLLKVEKDPWYFFSDLSYLVHIANLKPQAIYNFTEVGISPHRFIELGLLMETKLQFVAEDGITPSKLEPRFELGPLIRGNFFKGRFYAEAAYLAGISEKVEHHHCSITEMSTIVISVGCKFNPW